MADRAGNCFPGFSAFHQRFTFGEAARRHVGDEAGMRVAEFGAVRILRDFEDAASDRFGAAGGMELTMAARGGDERARRGGGFDHLHEHSGLQRSEVFGGLADVLVRCRLGDRRHARVVLARARLVVRHLPDQVLRGHAGDVGSLGMALAGHQVTGAAGEPDPRAARHRFRRGRVLVGKPVRRVRGAGDLGPFVFLRAAWRPHDAFRLHGARLLLVGNVEGPIGKPFRHLERLLGGGASHHEGGRERACDGAQGSDAGARAKDAADHGLVSSPFSSRAGYPGKGRGVHRGGVALRPRGQGARLAAAL